MNFLTSCENGKARTRMKSVGIPDSNSLSCASITAGSVEPIAIRPISRTWQISKTGLGQGFFGGLNFLF
jgi:hypothetical protein